jgi:outer membrane scaffolding protein for murein synthesis (MipA/OmpV family)
LRFRHRSSTYRIVALSVLALLLAPVARAEKLPLWEIGVGGGVLSVPEYRGSAESRVYPYPFVFPVYRGRHLQADEEGIKGMLLESDRFRFDISYDGNVPVKSESDARRGMDTLDPTVQIGPALRFKLWDSDASSQSVIADLPVRAAFAVGSGLEHVGYTAFPRAAYRREVRLLDRPWKWSLTGGALFGSEGFHRYYYQVDPVDATPERPVYEAGAGYGGLRFITTLYHRDRDKLISVFAAYDDVKDAVFFDSPLVERRSGITVGFLVTWFLFQSEDLVEVKQWEWGNP